MGEIFGGHIVRSARSMIDYEGRLAAARSQTGRGVVERGVGRGAGDGHEQAVEYALEQGRRPRSRPPPSPTPRGSVPGRQTCSASSPAG
jgi:hypothetical protein